VSDSLPADPTRSPAAVQAALEASGYLADEGLATVVFLALAMHRPLFLEGEPGSGKTELGRTLAQLTGGELIRLQCYEGIDVSQALYEWDYARQLLHLRASEQRGSNGEREVEDELYTERFLIRRPLLRALEGQVGGARPVLLIDEIDRADDEFEAFLLELLSEYAVTIPEIGRVVAAIAPVVVLTSNRTRDVHDALKRRSLYHWVEHPDFEREVAIVRRRVPDLEVGLVRQVAAAVEAMRELALFKPPGVAETIDWAESLRHLGVGTLDPATIASTLGSVLKYREDLERVRLEAIGLLVERSASRS
jgi:MoxR-like ATPase